MQTSGQELKLVYPQAEPEAQPENFVGMDFDNFYLQPLDDADRASNTQQAIDPLDEADLTKPENARACRRCKDATSLETPTGSFVAHFFFDCVTLRFMGSFLFASDSLEDVSSCQSLSFIASDNKLFSLLKESGCFGEL